MAESVTLPDPVASEEAASASSSKTSLKTPKKANSVKGIRINRRHTQEGLDAFSLLEFEKRTSKITEPDGRVVFEMKDIEVPSSWSQLATDILSQKYARKAGVPGTGNETSAKQVVHRVAHTIRKFGEAQGYFASSEDAEAFEQELAFLCITQRGAFNSPVWFNCGLYHEYGITGDEGNFAWDFETQTVVEVKNAYERPQCSACFIQKVGDSLMGIFELAKNEAKLFKYGSGTGSNFSALRSKYEKLSGGGVSSGLMSFLEVLDRGAGSIKSGGTTRRAAKMVTLDIDHPEIRDFIHWKVREEEKAKILIDGGIGENDWRGEAYRSVSGQNSNNSVRVSDEFMKAVENKEKFHTKFRTTGENFEEMDAEELFKDICEAAWKCADPGLQFDTTINDWHTCAVTGRINGSNPCSEYMFLDDTACNLASVNLVKFLNEDGSFDIEAYRHACRIFFIAQEILVDLSSYPTETIAKNSHDYRPLGLGYANLGTLLMMQGIPYDSDKGRSIAAALTAIMHCHAYSVSAEMASMVGTFAGYKANRESMLRVMRKHEEAAKNIDTALCPKELYEAACEDARLAVEMGEKYGYRNAQATVLAPTGTIGLLMDCDTTGVEPEFSIIKWKKLAGGGHFKIINKSIPEALKRLGYKTAEIEDIQRYVLGYASLEHAPHINPGALRELNYTDEEIVEANQEIERTGLFNDWTPHVNPKALRDRGLSEAQIAEATLHIEGSQTMEGAPHLDPNHLAVFDCANKCGNGVRYIEPLGHVKMMAAVQPFLSGAISKTVNLPNEASIEDIQDIYFEAWKMGLKAIAIYRDGSKHSQPLANRSDKKEMMETSVALPTGDLRGTKKELPAKRKGITVETTVGGQKLFLRTGEYENGHLGEIFIDSFKEGASYRSLLNCFAVAISIGLQYGVPLEKYVDSFTFTRFEPSGFTNHANIRTCTSIVDFIFRVLGMEYLGRTDFVHVEPRSTQLSEYQAAGRIQEAMQKEATLTEETYSVAQKNDYNVLDQELSKMMGDAPPCNQCGHITIRNGACYKCMNCGTSMGCS